MFLCKYIQVYSLVLCIIFSYSDSQEFNYKVIAPEYICSKDNMSITTIRLIGEDVPVLKYNWSVSFHMSDVKESRSFKQRHILMIWNSVRKLNEILQTVSKDDLSNGIILINNSMLTPDVKYIINLVVQKQYNGILKTDNKQINLEYISNTNKKSTITVTVSGQEVIFSNMYFTAKAEVKSCNNVFDYQISWHILDKSMKLIKKITTKSGLLHLAPGTLSAGKQYLIKCIVFDKKYKKNKISDALRISVLEKGMQIIIYIKYLKIGVNQTIYLNAFFSDPDSITGHLMFEWKCNNSANKICDEFESNNTTELLIERGFSKPGRYLFTVIAKKGGKNVQDSSMVHVVEEMLPIISIENAVTSCNPSDAITISAIVKRLAPECTLQWLSQNEKEFNTIDLTNVPGNPGKILKIDDEDENIENFSEENDDNELFIEKQFDFILPSSADNSWKGLQDNSKYLFRLMVSCPCLENSTTEDQEKFVMSFVDVVVLTNKLPIIKPLKVTPKSGQAIRTKFNFKTSIPYNCSKPLLYKFGILDKSNKKSFLVQQYDVVSADTILPFSDESIQTILEVCDSKSACNYTLGPKVIVKMPNNFTQLETESLMSDFKNLIIEQDYFNAFTISSLFIQTATQMSSNETLNLMDSIIKNVTKKEIETFLNATDENWLLPATNLLKHIKILDNDIHLPQDMLNDILVLRDKVSEKQNSLRKKQSKLEKLVSRKLLSVYSSKKSKRIVNDINIDDIKNYLEITEMAIKRLTEFERVDTEMQKLRNRLQYYLPIICQYLYKNNYKTNIRIELSSIILDVERINVIRKYNEFIFIPFDMDLAAKLQLGRDLAEKYRHQSGMCLGKVLFLEDYFHIPQYVFDVKLYSAISDNYLDSDATNFATVIEMPVKSVVSDNQMFQCVLWEDGDWNMNKCNTIEEYSGKVKCACKSLGYFSMVPVQRTTTLSTTRSTTEVHQELVTQQYAEPISKTVSTTMTETETIVIEQSHATVFQLQPTINYLITSTEQTNDHRDLYQTEKTDHTNLNSAAVWSISLLSIGIFTLLLAFLVLLRKLQRSKAVQSFQTIEYARYFDENNLE